MAANGSELGSFCEFSSMAVNTCCSSFSTRRSFHCASAICLTRATSVGPAGECSSQKEAYRLLYSSWLSNGSTVSGEERPCRRRLYLEAFLPSGVRGPVEAVALARLAAIWAGEV